MLRWILASSLLLTTSAAFADDKDYHDQDLSKKSFAQASLNGANFSGATLVECNFTQASLKKANFKDANVKYAYFYQADMTEADFTGATSSGQFISFSECKLDKAKLAGLNKNLVSLIFRSNCSLKEADLKKSKIGQLTNNCNLSRADLRGANMIKAFDINNPPTLKDALYDDDTAFPDGFDPKAAGLKLKNGDDEKKDDKKKGDKKDGDK